MLRCILVFVCLLISIPNSNAGTRDPLVSDSKHIEYGQKFKYVYKVCGIYENGKLFCGSAVVIDKRWALTAAHVIKDCKTSTIGDDKDQKIYVEKVFIHNLFDEDNIGSPDIALLYLEQQVVLDFYPSLYEKKDEEKKNCSISGFGRTGTFKTGATNFDDKKRAGSNTVEYIEADRLVCIASKRSEKPTELEFLIASGDSGGGLFIDGRLAGINSMVMAVDKKPDSSYGDESAHTRISSHIGWIRETMRYKGKDY